MRFDLKSNLALAVSLAIALRNASATVNGSSVDLQGYGSALVAVTTGTMTDGTVTFEVQESDDNAAWSAVADADLQGVETDLSLAATDDDKIKVVGYKGNKRYLRVASTMVAGATGGTFGALILRGHARHKGGVAV